MKITFAAAVRHLLICCACILAAACKKEDNSAPQLFVYPSQVDFGQAINQHSFVINNSGTGMLVWHIKNAPTWLTVSPSAGELENSSSVEVILGCNREDLENGYYTDSIEIYSNARGVYKVNVACSIAVDTLTPRLFVYPSQVDFGQAINQQSFVITNSGTGVLVWHIKNAPTWLTVSPSAGELENSSSIEVILGCNREDLEDGYYTDSIEIYSNARGVYKVNVACSIAVDTLTPRLFVYPSQVDFGQAINQQSFVITNSGTGVLVWHIKNAPTWLTVSPSAGELENSSSVEVILGCNREDLEDGYYTDSIEIYSNARGVYKVNVACEIATENTEMSYVALKQAIMVVGGGGGGKIRR